jgi:uridine kinase
MLNDRITVTPKHIEAANVVVDELLPKLKEKYLIAIGGEVGSGKSTMALAIAHRLKKEGVKSKIIDLDDFYLVPPHSRKAWRRKHGIQSVGPSEYDWDAINRVIEDFQQDRESSMPCVDLITGEVDHLTTSFRGIRVALFNGLYATMLWQSDFKVFLELTYRETMEAQLFGGKEEMTEFRKQILEREHKMVKALKPGCQMFFDFDASLDKYHL